MGRKQKMRESKKLYHTLVDRANDGIVIIQGKLLKFVNPRMAEILGYSVEELMDTPFLDHIHPDEHSRLLDRYTRRMAGEDVPSIYESILKHREGYKIFVEFNAGLTMYRRESADLVIVRDISERKKADEEMRFLAEVLNSSPLSVIATDMSGSIIYVNPATERLYGYTGDELLGKNPIMLNADPEAKKVQKDISDMIGQGLVWRGEILNKKKNGEIFPIYASVYQLMDEKKNFIAMVGFQQDITERKQAENALKESEEMYKTLLDISYDSVSLVDLEGRIIKVFEKTLELHDYERAEEMVGRNGFEFLLAPEDLEKGKKYLQRALKDGYIKDIELNLLRKDGSSFNGELSCALIKDAGEEPNGFIVVSRDVTERKRNEEEMKRRLMNFNLKEGNLYLVKEPTPALSIEALKDFCKIGSHSLVISRTSEEELREVIGGDCNHLWLGEMGERALNPDLKEMEERIANLPKKSAVLITRLDYLITKNGFVKTLGFVQSLKDLAYLNDLIIILSIDPEILDGRELKSLEKESKEIEPRGLKIKLSDSLFEVLKLVYSQNNKGVRPILSEIGKELGISRPTVNNRVKLLISGGYLKEDMRGRKKFLELTEKGWRLFID